jgi:uncharacterized protein with HEPN domain
VKRSRRQHRARLDDIDAAIAAIRAHLRRGDVADGMVFDAVRMRLVEIGAAVGSLPEALLDTESATPWREVVAMRHKLAHHYYDSPIGIIAATVHDDLPELERAVVRLRSRLDEES